MIYFAALYLQTYDIQIDSHEPFMWDNFFVYFYTK